MKMLKKVSTIMLLVAALLLTGCGSKQDHVEGKLPDLMAKLYDGIPEENRPMMLQNMEVTEETVENFLGTKDVEYKEALASESAVGSIAHSVVLVRTKDGADVEKAMDTIKKHVNPRKWLCVGIEDDEVIIKNRGDLILVVIVQDEENRGKIEKNFDNL